MGRAALDEAMEGALVLAADWIAEVPLDPLPAPEQLQVPVETGQADLAQLG